MLRYSAIVYLNLHELNFNKFNEYFGENIITKLFILAILFFHGLPDTGGTSCRVGFNVLRI